MTNLVKTSTSYDVASELNGIKAEGTTTTLVDGQIQDLYLYFTFNNENIGNVNYNERGEDVNYNYTIRDNSKKDEINQLTDSIIADIKAQMA